MPYAHPVKEVGPNEVPAVKWSAKRSTFQVIIRTHQAVVF